jgi:GNAT superfamily N-acetyltransferase
VRRITVPMFEMLQFIPLNIDDHIDFCTAAHRETFRLTFGSEISDEYLEREHEKMREHYALDPASVVLATLAGKRIGLAEIQTRGKTGSAYGWVNFFYITPEERENGYGAELIKYAAGYFRSLGLTQIFLRVGRINKAAARFYLRNGFIRSPNGDRDSELLLVHYIDGLPFDVSDILQLYGAQMNYEISDNSHGDKDRRFTIIAEFAGMGKIVIKAARNAFTTPERVAGWASLAQHYNALGIYAPRFLRNANGGYGSIVGGCCVYAEAFAKFAPDESINYEQSAEARLTALGKAAAHPAPIVPWPAPYALYDKFDENDDAPEIYDNGLRVIRRISEQFPQYAGRAASIMREYERRRTEFELVYRALPKAVFQADMNRSNLLYDNSRFVGLWDFNLSGTDAVLAYAFYECFYYMTEAESDIIKQGAVTVPIAEERLRRNLGYVARAYTFTDAEKASFGTYFNLAVPFWGANAEAYHKLIRDHCAAYIPQILDFVEFQMTRRDVDDWLMETR